MLLPVSLIGHCLCHLFILFSNKFCLLMQSLLWLAALALASKPWQILQLCHFCQLIVLLLQKNNCYNYCHSLLHWHCCQNHNLLQLLSPKQNCCFFYKMVLCCVVAIMACSAGNVTSANCFYNYWFCWLLLLTEMMFLYRQLPLPVDCSLSFTRKGPENEA